jgi:hypothetical protein
MELKTDWGDYDGDEVQDLEKLRESIREGFRSGETQEWDPEFFKKNGRVRRAARGFGK